MRNKTLVRVLITLMLVVFAGTGVAADAGLPDAGMSCSLTVTLCSNDGEQHIASGAEVTIWQIAELSIAAGDLSYSLTDAFVSSGCDVNSELTSDDIDNLCSLISEGSITGISGITGSDGTVVFDGLAQGIYLVRQTGNVDGFESFNPFVVYLPNIEDGGWNYDVTAEPKMIYSVSPAQRTPVEVTVTKVWNDDGSNRPESVKVELYNEDGAYQTVTLNAGCSWQYKWTGLDPDKKWEIRETEVPQGYTATYSAEGYNFTITNTYKLPQTGQTNWPVPVLIFAGMLVLSAGAILRYTGRRDES